MTTMLPRLLYELEKGAISADHAEREVLRLFNSGRCLLDNDNAWNTHDVIVKLVEAADILLHKKDYDGPDWEEIEICYQRGKEILQQLPVIGSWVAVTERLPDLTDKEYEYGHKVITCWGTSKKNMAQMNYRTRTVRGKKIDYFEWDGRIDPFGVKYWMEFPQPPNFR